MFGRSSPETPDEVFPTWSKFPRITYIRKRMFSFIFMRLTRVVVLYTSLRLVEAVYKPQRACVGWASVIELCLEACMWIKRTCLDEVPSRHPIRNWFHIQCIHMLLICIYASCLFTDADNNNNKESKKERETQLRVLTESEGEFFFFFKSDRCSVQCLRRHTDKQREAQQHICN